jgi:hypothetical protein
VEFETVERSVLGQLSVEAAQTSVFTRRLAPNSELRLPVWDGVFQHTHASGTFGGVGQTRVSVLRRFSGKDQTGKPIAVEVTVHLDSSTGKRMPEPTAIALPPAIVVQPDDLRTLAGTWRGYFRDGSPFALPLQFTVAENGTFEGAIDAPVTSRARGSLVIRDGRIAYTRGPDTGFLTLHQQGNQRVLDGTISGTREGNQPGTTYPVSFAFRLAAVASGGSGATAAPVSPPSASPSRPPSSTTSPTVPPSTATSAQSDVLTNDGVPAMVKAGIDESVILLKIRSGASAFDVRADALVQLKQAGVSDRILEAIVTRAAAKP